ncbi:membrane hypothetical protein [Candidatus Terasakiella magnetica]|uniref:TrbC/VIRB2 family protein n=1 Tax=Candidatus Terasakiella magnetica TaxID=1867952 RepID=A0A1C3RLE8_9PROT|nr:TrbC/VirB2 family protein [Candidatus Terasakiella magnetica]SCA58140.1 membrane hypothetical protein [Candidatus Terasakiella magnetica]
MKTTTLTTKSFSFIGLTLMTFLSFTEPASAQVVGDEFKELINDFLNDGNIVIQGAFFFATLGIAGWLLAKGKPWGWIGSVVLAGFILAAAPNLKDKLFSDNVFQVD